MSDTRAVPFCRTVITAEARRAADRVLRSGWVTMGPETERFEAELAAQLGIEHVVAVSSCTAAIELSLRALGLPAGTGVLTPTITFCGAVGAIARAGLRPVLVDADEATLAVSPETVADAASRQPVGAMVAQAMAGYPLDPVPLAAAAGLSPEMVIEDAAHGLGATVRGQQVGTLSRAGCYSFYATKNLPIGEGGAIVTKDPGLAHWARQARLHGMSHDAWRRYAPGAPAAYRVDQEGYKANLTDLQAAIGRAQLRMFDIWQRRRTELAARYDEELADLPGIILPPRPARGGHAWHLYMIRIRPGFGPSRDETAAGLAAAGVGTSVHFTPVHHYTYFQELLGPLPALPVADRLAGELLSLPLHQGLTFHDIDAVCEAVRSLHPPLRVGTRQLVLRPKAGLIT